MQTVKFLKGKRIGYQTNLNEPIAKILAARGDVEILGEAASPPAMTEEEPYAIADQIVKEAQQQAETIVATAQDQADEMIVQAKASVQVILGEARDEEKRIIDEAQQLVADETPKSGAKGAKKT